MKPLSVSVNAQKQIRAAVDYYEQARPGLGREFVDEIAAALRNASLFPKIAPVLRGRLRRAVLDQFPFCILYREKLEILEILAVHPTRSDPRRLQSCSKLES